MYIWERQEWLRLTWDDGRLLEPIVAARLYQGRLLGKMSTLGFELKLDAQLEAPTQDIVYSSEIEGEVLDRESPRYPNGHCRAGRRANRRLRRFDARRYGEFYGSSDARTVFRLAGGLVPDRLFRVAQGQNRRMVRRQGRTDAGRFWTDRSSAGALSGTPARQFETETRAFLDWFNCRTEPEGLVRAGVAHLWFATIHPF